MRSIAWAFGGVLACLSGAVAGVLFGSQFLGMNFQSAELAPISNTLKAAYEKAVAASHSIGETLASSREESKGTASRIDQAGTITRVRSPDRTPLRAQPAAPLLTTFQIKSQPIRIVRQDDQSYARAQVVISGLTPPDVRAAVARDIERELARAGCRVAHTDGSWNSSSRAAMRQFLRNVNATLPSKDPDMILLTLVRGYHGTSCGVGCGRNAKDRCTPPLEAKRAPHVDTPQRAAVDSGAEKADVVHDTRTPARPRVRWVAVPQTTGHKGPVRKAPATSTPTPTAQASAAVPGTTTGDASKRGRMALGVPRPQPVERLKSPSADAPANKDQAGTVPANLPAPYAPGAPRLVPDRKPETEISASPKPQVAPIRRRSSGNPSWRKRVFQVEN